MRRHCLLSLIRRVHIGFLAKAALQYTRQIEMGGVTQEQVAHALLSYRLGITFRKAMQALT